MALQTSAHIPVAALWLGIAGVLPFAGCALQIATGLLLGPRMTGPALYLLLTYGAAILSFMGGVQWGLAVAGTGAASNDWRRYGVSVIPALIAWLGLYVGARNGLLIVAAAFAALLIYDLRTVAAGEAPAWYGRLRVGLTTAVVACLVVAALLGPF